MSSNVKVAARVSDLWMWFREYSIPQGKVDGWQQRYLSTQKPRLSDQRQREATLVKP